MLFSLCRGGHRGCGVHPGGGRQRGQHQRRRGGGPLQPPKQLQRHQLHSHTFPQTAATPLLGHRAAIRLPASFLSPPTTPTAVSQSQTPPTACIMAARLGSIPSLLVPPPRPHQEANGARMPAPTTDPTSPSCMSCLSQPLPTRPAPPLRPPR